MYNNLQISYGQSPSLQPQVATSGGEGEGPNIPNVRLSFITTADQTKFEQLYVQGCAGGKYLTGEGTKEILVKSKLPADTLAQIWKLSNLTKNNYLTFPEFALAMYLTNLKINKQDLPNKLPDNIRNEVMGVIEQIKVIEQEYQKRQHNQRAISPSHTQMISHQQYTGVPMGHNIGQYSSSNQSGIQNGPMMPGMMPFTQRMMPQQNPQQQYSTTGIVGNAKIPWAVTPDEKIQYREIFRQWDSQGLGYLTGEKAREILSQSGLPQSDLMQIWNLSDPNNNGKLNQDEFAVAMHLIYRKLNGYDIPTTLPPELIPPSSRELSESVNILKNMLNSEVHNTSIGLGTHTSGANYTKSRSFTVAPTIDKNDAVGYKHKDDDVGYVSSSRYRVPTLSRSQNTSPYSSLSRSSSVSESIGEDRSSKISELKKQIHEKHILLEALSITADTAPIPYDSSYSSDYIDVKEWKNKIKNIQEQITEKERSNPEWLNREFTQNSEDLNSLLEQHKNLDYELNNMLVTTVPELISRVRETDNKIADAKLELFKLRESSGGGSDLNIIGTGPGGTITESDRIKAKAQAMIQGRLAAMTGKPVNLGGGGSNSRRLEEETDRINSDKAEREYRVSEIERNISKLQDSAIRVSREREEIEDKYRKLERNKRDREGEIQKWEDGIGVEDEVRRFIQDLKRDSFRSSSTSRYDYNDTYSSSRSVSYNRRPSTSSTSSSVYTSASNTTSSSLSKTKSPEEREAFIKAEAERRMQEKLKAFGVKTTSYSKSTSSTPDSPTLSDRLAREKAEAAERKARAEREAEERERTRTEKLLAEKQRKAELEAEKLRKMEEFEKREEERRNQWLAEAKELEKAKDRKAREKEEVARARELELERKRIEEAEREKKLEEERSARVKREAEERAAEEERRRIEQEALVENSKAAREKAKKMEEEAKQREEAAKRETEKLKTKREDSLLSVKSSDSDSQTSTPSSVNSSSNNPFLKLSTQEQKRDNSNENNTIESTNPFFKFTSGTTAKSNEQSSNDKQDDDDDWNVVNNEESSDDDFLPGNTKDIAHKLFGSSSFELQSSSSSPSPLKASTAKSDSIPSPPPSSNSNFIPPPPPLPSNSNSILPSPPPPPSNSNSIPPPPSLPNFNDPSNLNAVPPPPPLPTTLTPVPPPPPQPQQPSSSGNQSQSSLPPSSNTRSALLGQIQQGARLKPTKTNDRSSPLVAGKTGDSNPSTQSSSGGASQPATGMGGLGALFAGGIPKLKNRGGVETGRSATEDITSKSSPGRTDRRVSADWFGNLSSDQLAGEETSKSQSIIKTETPVSEGKNIFEQDVTPHTSTSADNDIDYSHEFRVKSLFAYPGTGGADDLKFDAGVIFMAHPSKDPNNVEWWHGVIKETGSKGWFPKTYVEIYKEEKEICKAKVLYDYKAQNSEELDIKAGNIVSILDKSLGDWWKAEFGGSKGIVPAIYVEEITNSSG